MLADPLTIKPLDIDTATNAVTVLSNLSLATIDLSPGRTVRIGNPNLLNENKMQLTIAHSVSNDNKPTLTDRTLIRMDASLATSEAVPLNGYAYLVVGTPRGAFAGPDAYDPLLLVGALIGLLSISDSAATLSNVRLKRILAGEP
jgi:hypothetical protein